VQVCVVTQSQDAFPQNENKSFVGKMQMKR
jgi:hypothetical protein